MIPTTTVPAMISNNIFTTLVIFPAILNGSRFSAASAKARPEC
jgi:hypothetical protein